jgi:hypothetical protein
MKDLTNTQPNSRLKFHTRPRLEKLVKSTWIKHQNMAPKLVPCRSRVYFETFPDFFLLGLRLVTLNHFSLVPKNVSMVES